MTVIEGSFVLAVLTFVFGVIQYFRNERRQSESRRIEAAKPFLERQLKLYTEATQAVATLATSENAAELARARKRFWSLYWGELALVEDKNVEAAMIALGKGFKQNADHDQIEQLCLKLAHACRESLAASWGVKEWQSHYRGKLSTTTGSTGAAATKPDLEANVKRRMEVALATSADIGQPRERAKPATGRVKRVRA